MTTEGQKADKAQWTPLPTPDTSQLTDFQTVEVVKTQESDLQVTLTYGGSLGINLSGLTTVQQVIDAIRFQSRGMLTATPNGNGLLMTDHTFSQRTGFRVSNVAGSNAVDVMGWGAGLGGPKQGGNLGINKNSDALPPIVTNGNYLPDLLFLLTSGDVFSVSLFGVTKAGDLIQAIEKQTSGMVTAQISNGGILLTDTSANNQFSVENIGNATAAGQLGIAVSQPNSPISAALNVDGGNPQRDTLLSGINGGIAVAPSFRGDIRITVRDGTSYDISLTGATTLGGLIDAIHFQANDAVSASLAENSLVLTDNSLQPKTFKI